MKTYFLAALFYGVMASQVASPVAAQWSYHGFSGGTLRELQLHEGDLYVASERGLYRKRADQADTTWTLFGLEGQHVRTFERLGDGTWLAVIHLYSDGQAQDQRLYRTTDGGSTWSRVAMHLEQDAPEELFKVVRRLPGESRTLLAGGFHGMWKSEDGGSTWRKVAEASDVHFLVFDPVRPEHIWSGGESNILWPYLLPSTDGGETWRWMQLDLGGDNAVYAMVIDPVDSDILYIGMEGYVLKSVDGGETWQRVLDPPTHEYFHGLSLSPGNPNRMYAAGIRNTAAPQGPTLYVSDNQGVSWYSFSTGAEKPYFGVVAMAVRSEGGGDVVYLGTHHDGVYSFTAPTNTGVDEVPATGYALRPSFPNPFRSETKIGLSVDRSQQVRVEVFDMLGRRVALLYNGFMYAGREEQIMFDAAELPSGLYAYLVQGEDFAGTGTVMLVR